ncbi:MAG: hypothetical protein COU85_00235 [Candidatus Portnoybacteria bacterium CG10_big_fil_rev_8_21_14_0_10_44_7]|uniref:VTT domain-containing protein n=1 Tax=Candidatus Portnoybacteria bacterium CG10_big_fil_rev_8_21_14_0_10_44_7 TaxID=1974816 RepID=A0A2M8KJH8_9BACT|nr:MAG: hypothetical protein COU85_00235 [Candidatus Portnoybacteria bacterium CG10_big_fil_rev_8_21_14_0_10_44_7]
MQTCTALLAHLCLSIGSGGQVAAYFLIALGMVFEGEIFLLVAGSLTFFQILYLPWVLLAALLGTFAGDVFWYKLGRRYGRGLIQKYGRWFLIPSQRFAKMEKMVLEHGPWLIFLTKFLYGLNHAFLVAAGAIKFGFKKFLRYQLPASAFWMFVFVFLGHFFASSLAALKKDIHFFGLSLLGLIVLILILERAFGKKFISRFLNNNHNNRQK